MPPVARDSVRKGAHPETGASPTTQQPVNHTSLNDTLCYFRGRRRPSLVKGTLGICPVYCLSSHIAVCHSPSPEHRESHLTTTAPTTENQAHVRTPSQDAGRKAASFTVREDPGEKPGPSLKEQSRKALMGLPALRSGFLCELPGQS